LSFTTQEGHTISYEKEQTVPLNLSKIRIKINPEKVREKIQTYIDLAVYQYLITGKKIFTDPFFENFFSMDTVKKIGSSSVVFDKKTKIVEKNYMSIEHFINEKERFYEKINFDPELQKKYH